LREQALEDSRLIRSRFSVHRGVRSIVTGLYAEEKLAHAIGTQAWRQS
jgi:hypothetical protein